MHPLSVDKYKYDIIKGDKIDRFYCVSQALGRERILMKPETVGAKNDSKR